MKTNNSVVYKTEIGKIQVSLNYSDHSKKYYVEGSLYGKLETGGSSYRKEIKSAIKKFIKDRNLKMNGNIEHSIYGIYSVGVE